jgi:hypothetical protein
MSIRQTAVPLGGAVGALLLPAVALHLGFAAMYAVLAALCGLSALLAWAWVQEPPVPGALREFRQVSAGSEPRARQGRADGPLRDARMWRLAAGIGILCAPQFAVLSFGTVFLHDFGHAGLATIAAAMTALQVGAMGMRVWSGRWTDRHRNRPAYLRACSLLSMLLFAAMALLALAGEAAAGTSGPLRALLIGLLAASGICVSAWHGVAYTELASLAGAARAGTALGMANTSVFLVCFLTPLGIPHLLTLQGWPLVWLAAAGCAAAALPLLTASQAKASNAALSRPT